MCDMEMMAHIVLHSIQVFRVASLLTTHLNGRQHRLDADLIQAAALLHDITKTRSFKTGENHAETGDRFLADAGYSEVGELVRQHVRLDVYPNTAALDEAAVINYSDKRVLHDRVVPLNRRKAYILKKYGKVPKHEKRIRWLFGKTLELESTLFSDLTMGPSDLGRVLNNEDREAYFLDFQKTCSGE